VDYAGVFLLVIACDKREAFAQGRVSDEAIYSSAGAIWIVSRSLSSGAHPCDPLARNDEIRSPFRLPHIPQRRFDHPALLGRQRGLRRDGVADRVALDFDTGLDASHEVA